ncbi:murein L,D-transpeptidase family protein [Methylocystis echinoides]|uniref:murein L,D-transpeptidase family protein n=1 Tax=Methylocystis echinoides TaxID=29468 RepID=UPI0034469BF1
MTFRVLKPAAAVAFAALSLAACNDSGLSHRSLAPVPRETVALMEKLGTSKDAPMLIRAYKKEAELEIWKMGSDGKYVHLKTFPMCRWSGQLGPKTREGDRQVPEGFYSITPAQMNPNSSYYLSFNVGYPNQLDKALGHTGGTIMVHGACSSAGCFSMTDAQIAEIYAIARASFEGGQQSIQMQSLPFRMTAENLAKHRLDSNIGFWRNLKEGSDHFEVTKMEPEVAFCGRRYVFNAAADGRMDPLAACPPLKQDPEIVASVSAKSAKDEEKIAELSQSVKPVRVVYQDGGMHPSFLSKVAETSRPEAVAPPEEIALDDKAGRGKAAQIASKSPVVTMAAAKAAAPTRPTETTSVARALSADTRREMSALAATAEDGPTSSIKRALKLKK